MDGPALARAAVRHVGCRFRLHGRDPATGLDCVGLVAAALAAAGRPVQIPRGYPLRPGSVPELERLAARHGFAPAPGAPQPGDVWVTRPGPGQVHLAIVDPSGTGLVEAHAGLGRVVISPLRTATMGVQGWRLIPAAV